MTELAYEHMNRPQLVKIESERVTADRVRQCCYMVSNEEKIPLLMGLVRGWSDARIMVFVNTKREADRVWGYLQGNGVNTAVLSGDVPQKQRLRLLREFTEGTLPVLVGTDVAARGLHIPDVTHVVNYDLPEDPEDYVHRIGRTARAGAAGDAIGFVCETYAFCLPDIEAFIGAKIPVEPIDPELLIAVDPGTRLRPERARPDARPGGRRSGEGRASGGARRRGGRDARSSEGAGRGRAYPAPAAPPVEPAVESQPPSTAPKLTSSPPCALTDPAADPAPRVGGEGGTAEPMKKRRRRRRKPSTGAGSDAGTRQEVTPPVIEPID